MINYYSAKAVEPLKNLDLCICYMLQNDDELYVKKLKQEDLFANYKVGIFSGRMAIVDNPILYDLDTDKINAGEYCRVSLIEIINVG